MKLEILKNECFYHIYNRGINSCAIFTNDDNKRFFLKKLKEHLQNTIIIYAYCLMDNHFHLAIKVLNETEVTQKFSNFFNAYAKAYNKQENRTGSLFEKHFKRIQLKDENYLQNLIVYIHQNPMKHLQLNFTKYSFSSYAPFLSDKETLLPREDVFNLFSDIENFKFMHLKEIENLTEFYTLE